MPVHRKLVRDRIPEIIKLAGKELTIETLTDERYVKELKMKLNEETEEYQGAKTDAEALEELADVLELMHALARTHGADIHEVEKIRAKKAEKRGGFNSKIFLIEVEDD